LRENLSFENLTTNLKPPENATEKTHANWIAESSLAWRAIPCHAGGPQSITNNPYRTSFPRRYRLERAKLLQGAKQRKCNANPAAHEDAVDLIGDHDEATNHALSNTAKYYYYTRARRLAVSLAPHER
jgi:hypothetical protein